MTSAMVDFVTRTVGWKVDARYNALSYDVDRLWDRDDDLRKGSVPDLRQAVAADPKLRVLIVHGWNDLSCPFMGSVLTVDQMPVMGDPTRVVRTRISRRTYVLHARLEPHSTPQRCYGYVREALKAVVSHKRVVVSVIVMRLGVLDPLATHHTPLITLSLTSYA